MKRPTSQPHSPSPHGLWSAHRLLQHLKQASRTMLFSSTYWINLLTKHKLIHWLFNILSSPFWLHTCDLYSQHFQSCWEISQLGTMTWERQKFWRKKSFKKMWNTKHLLRHSASQSIPPASPASLPGALHWLWSLLEQGPCNHIYKDREIGHLTICFNFYMI